jgi:hypothetical protein
MCPVQSFIAWSQHARLGASIRSHLRLLRPSVSDALAQQPSHRTAQQLEAIRCLLEELPMAGQMPKEAMDMFCRFCTFEVLHKDMVRASLCVRPFLLDSAS